MAGTPNLTVPKLLNDIRAPLVYFDGTPIKKSYRPRPQNAMMFLPTCPQIMYDRKDRMRLKSREIFIHSRYHRTRL